MYKAHFPVAQIPMNLVLLLPYLDSWAEDCRLKS